MSIDNEIEQSAYNQLIISILKKDNPDIKQIQLSKPEPFKQINFYGTEVKRFQRTTQSGIKIITLLNKPGIHKKKKNKHVYFEGFSFKDTNIVDSDDAILPQNPIKDKDMVKSNCHAYAIGSIFGIAENEWLESFPNELTDNTNPVKSLLQEYFSQIQIKTIQIKAEKDNNYEEFNKNTNLKSGDVIVFYGEKGGIIHSGRIVKVRRGGEIMNYIDSKLGEYMATIAPLKNLTQVYTFAASIKIYRIKETQQNIK